MQVKQSYMIYLYTLRIALGRRVYATEAVASSAPKKLEVFVNDIPVYVDPDTTVLQVSWQDILICLLDNVPRIKGASPQLILAY